MEMPKRKRRIFLLPALPVFMQNNFQQPFVSQHLLQTYNNRYCINMLAIGESAGRISVLLLPVSEARAASSDLVNA